MDDNLKTYLEGLNGAFEEFKATNDQRLAEIEKKGEADPLVEAKLSKIEADLDRFETVNQKLVQQEKASEGFAEKLDDIETLLKRPNSGVETKSVDFAVKAWDKFMRKGNEGLDADEVKALKSHQFVLLLAFAPQPPKKLKSLQRMQISRQLGQRKLAHAQKPLAIQQL